MIEGKRCAICKQEWNEVELYEGILGPEMIMICEECSEKEGIPTIKKPTGEQIKKTTDSRSVRERMERLSGMRDTTGISKDQEGVQHNLHKLKAPPKKETNPFVLDNYYWAANMGRRRKKITLKQAAEAMGLDPDLIDGVERGKIPEDFEIVFDKMEKFYGVKMLKNQSQKIHFVRTREEEEEILEDVKKKMAEDKIVLKDIKKGDKKDVTEKFERGELDFSKKEELENITLNDLVEMKNRKKKVEEAKRIRQEIEGMVGEDLELDEDLLDL